MIGGTNNDNSENNSKKRAKDNNEKNTCLSSRKTIFCRPKKQDLQNKCNSK